MRLVCLSLSLLFLLFTGNNAEAAPVTPRPYTGRGLLIITGLPQENGPPGRLILYREPGVGRVADKPLADLPLLTRIIKTVSGDYPVAVLTKKGDWLQVAYDEGGRSGWLEMQRRWRYVSWEGFLPGRSFRLLPGLRKEFYTVQSEPSPSAAKLGARTPMEEQRTEKVRGDWLGFSLADGTFGWLRWRDESGRFLIALPSGNDQQNR